MDAAQYNRFSHATFEFLDDLTVNNNRSWFQANKFRYEDEVREPALQFIRAMEPELVQISPNFVANARKAGGSLMRVYRDIRFSRDKTPYKTNIGIQFRHESGKDVHAPGYYVHISLERVFLGAGIWRPDSNALGNIRTAINDDGKAWIKACDDKQFHKSFTLSGDSLKRPPRGYSGDHPLLEDLKRKDFIAISDLSPPEIFREDFVHLVRNRFVAATPLMQFLCKAQGLPF